MAAFTGRATFALMSDMAARSGSGSPASRSSSSRVTGLYSMVWSVMLVSSLVALGEVDRLLGVRIGDRVVRGDVQRDGRVDRGRHVRIDQRHGGPLRQLLASELVELLAGDWHVLLPGLLGHCSSFALFDVP